MTKIFSLICFQERIHLEYSGMLGNGTLLSDDDAVVQIPCHYTFKFILDNSEKGEIQFYINDKLIFKDTFYNFMCFKV